jgi:hypothetical protein
MQGKVSQSVSLPQVSQGACGTNKHLATPRDASEAPVAKSVAGIVQLAKWVAVARLWQA